jgi:hypothetical protein
MITLDYKVRDAPGEGLDLGVVDESTLHYDLFLGDVTFRVDEADMSASWGLDSRHRLCRVPRSNRE